MNMKKNTKFKYLFKVSIGISILLVCINIVYVLLTRYYTTYNAFTSLVFNIFKSYPTLDYLIILSSLTYINYKLSDITVNAIFEKKRLNILLPYMLYDEDIEGYIKNKIPFYAENPNKGLFTILSNNKDICKVQFLVADNPVEYISIDRVMDFLDKYEMTPYKKDGYEILLKEGFSIQQDK